jgi:hypothetical protein
MMADPTSLRKNYSEPFVLDRGKLSRMLTIIEQEALESSTQFQPEFEVEFKNNKRAVLHSIQEVLSLDNSVRNPVRAIDVKAEIPGLGDDAARIGTLVRLHFDSDTRANIILSVIAPHTKLATELFAELEEQVDRTIVTNWIPRFLKSQLVLPLVGLVLAMLLSLGGRF